MGWGPAVGREGEVVVLHSGRRHLRRSTAVSFICMCYCIHRPFSIPETTQQIVISPPPPKRCVAPVFLSTSKGPRRRGTDKRSFSTKMQMRDWHVLLAPNAMQGMAK